MARKSLSMAANGANVPVDAYAFIATDSVPLSDGPDGVFLVYTGTSAEWYSRIDGVVAPIVAGSGGSVVSVNGLTGVVNLPASGIPSNGPSNVQSDITSLNTAVAALQPVKTQIAGNVISATSGSTVTIPPQALPAGKTLGTIRTIWIRIVPGATRVDDTIMTLSIPMDMAIAGWSLPSGREAVGGFTYDNAGNFYNIQLVGAAGVNSGLGATPGIEVTINGTDFASQNVTMSIGATW